MDMTEVERYAGYVLVGLGVLLYLIFGLVKGAPTDVGVYAITIVPIVIGVGLLWRTGDADAGAR